MSSFSSSLLISLVGMNSEYISSASSVNDRPDHLDSQSFGSSGIRFGMYSPPSGANPDKTVL